MAQIPIGSARQQELVVNDEVAIRFIGLEAARVLSTPHLIMLLEMTCRNLLIDFLEPGHDSVGTIVEVRHLAATPIGMRVTARAEIVAVEGRRVDFRVEAHDEREKVAEGAHQRFIVNVERFAARIQDKAGPA
ncbi:MAG: thioesterase family protein [Acidobacteriota bacterium]